MLLGFGATVFLSDVNTKNLEREAARLNEKYPGKASGIQTDVTKKEDVEAMVNKTAAVGGQLDFLFNNAGLGLAKPFDQTTLEDWQFAFNINFYSVLYGTYAALPIMRKQGSGHIANTASGIAFTPMPNQTMYSATKSAVLAFSGALRAELWDENIHVSTIIPGTVATAIWEGKPPKGAITPEESARGILKGIVANNRIIIVTEDDANGARSTNNPDNQKGIDEYLLGVARARRAGKIGL